MNQLSQFFAHLVHLFQKKAPTIEAFLQPEIDLFTSLLKKFAAADLGTAVTTILAAITAGTPFGAVVETGAAALKATVIAQGIEATDEELQLVAQSIAKNQAKAVNVSLQAAQAGLAPTPAIGVPAPTADAPQ